MRNDSDPLAELSLPDQSRVNALCDRFEDALQQSLEPRLEDFLANTSGLFREVLFRELLLLECKHALRLDRDVHQSRLLARFPNRVESISEVLGLAEHHLYLEGAVANGSSEPAGRAAGLPETFGRFRLLDAVGHGAFGTVFRAVDTKSGNEVALKVPHLVTLLSLELRERFFREARAAEALEHPGIVRLLEVGEEGVVCYIASEYVDGTTLAAWLSRHDAKQEQPFFKTAAQVVARLAEAMQHAHERGVFHCDLKPANVLLRHGRITEPVVTDFGLARLVGEGTKLTVTGQLLGTPAYMAPEQAFGPRRDPGRGPDIYGLGAILYEMLTGHPPFQAPTPLEILILKRNAEPVPPHLMSPRIPRALEAICLKCLESQPEKRYPTAGNLAADLERWLRGEPVQARSVGLPGRGLRWCRRRPVIATLAAALILAILIGFAGVLGQWRRAEAARRDSDRALEVAEMERGEAEASEAQVVDLLNELLLPTPEAHVQRVGSRSVPDITVLLGAEERFQALLQRRPDDIKVRSALTNVEIRLSRLYAFQGQLDQAELHLRIVQELWEKLVKQESGNSQYRDWLSTAYIRQSEAAFDQGNFEQSAQSQLRAYSLLQALADEQPGNDDLQMRVFARATALLGHGAVGTGQEGIMSAVNDLHFLTNANFQAARWITRATNSWISCFNDCPAVSC